ncbi:hypothetical protein [Paenibacillus sp. Marseille-Q4541]|uniref:hypothetical protein n=1 Tax=Paenibacillus sp. Marseille-Q4541 TaxID=2831522 RepID=UPI001BA52D6A|nr:hypothetical protein [Paenibacillus sp. Marseille-Q4541]
MIDYVTFPSEAKWLADELADYKINIVYAVLLVDQDTIVTRDHLRPEEVQMGERSLILLDEFENDPELRPENKLYTQLFTVEQLPDIIHEIMNNPNYIVNVKPA